MTTVLVVAKTHWWDHVCVGALSRSPVQHLRLLHDDHEKMTEADGYEVGQVREILFRRPARTDPPHVEDVQVTQTSVTRTLTPAETRDAILRYVQPTAGSIRRLFQETLHIAPGEHVSAYVAPTHIPDHSTEFWTTDQLLTLHLSADGKPYYHYRADGADVKVKYVGYAPPIEHISAGSLVRMSLARWYNQQGHTEPRCYLQLSGWW
jgi:hypothetical protein